LAKVTFRTKIYSLQNPSKIWTGTFCLYLDWVQ
jgi:hypothetical protein